MGNRDIKVAGDRSEDGHISIAVPMRHTERSFPLPQMPPNANRVPPKTSHVPTDQMILTAPFIAGIRMETCCLIEPVSVDDMKEHRLNMAISAPECTEVKT